MYPDCVKVIRCRLPGSAQRRHGYRCNVVYGLNGGAANSVHPRGSRAWDPAMAASLKQREGCPVRQMAVDPLSRIA